MSNLPTPNPPAAAATPMPVRKVEQARNGFVVTMQDGSVFVFPEESPAPPERTGPPAQVEGVEVAPAAEPPALTEEPDESAQSWAEFEEQERQRLAEAAAAAPPSTADQLAGLGVSRQRILALSNLLVYLSRSTVGLETDGFSADIPGDTEKYLARNCPQATIADVALCQGALERLWKGG